MFSGPQQGVQPTASTLALWWLKFGPTGAGHKGQGLRGGRGVFVVLKFVPLRKRKMFFWGLVPWFPGITEHGTGTVHL